MNEFLLQKYLDNKCFYPLTSVYRVFRLLTLSFIYTNIIYKNVGEANINFNYYNISLEISIDLPIKKYAIAVAQGWITTADQYQSIWLNLNE